MISLIQKNKFLDSIDLNVFSNIGSILVLILIMTPIEMMLLTPIIGNENSRNLMYIILIVSGLLGLFMGVIYLVKTTKKECFFKDYLPVVLFLLLLTWCFISSLFSINKQLSFFGDFYRKDGLITYFAYFGIFCIPFIIKKEKFIKKVFCFLIVIELIVAIVSLMDNDLTYLLTENSYPYTGIFSQFNHYGYYLMFGILSSLIMFFTGERKYKYFYFLTYILLLFTLVINDTFGCFIAIIVSLIIFLILFKDHKKNVLLIIISSLIVFLFTTRNGENVVYKNFYSLITDFGLIAESVNDIDKIDTIGTSRGKLWKYGIKYINEKPIFGYGIETASLLYSKDGISQDRPHNIILQFGIFTGIPGILIYLLFILSIYFKNLIKINKNELIKNGIFIICICYSISSMFGNSMFYTSPYFFIFLGFLNKESNALQNELRNS